jgi:hypothetical protein
MTQWHLISCEYPPKIGGVSDYTFVIAKELAKTGDLVHVWCGADAGDTPQSPGVTVHRELGSFLPSDFWRAGKLLDKFPAPRGLFVQWVPQGYGYRSMNVFFCLWLWMRAKVKHDQIEIMFHEVWLSFGISWKVNIAAAVHRVMVAILKRAASKIWISGEAWRKFLPGATAPVGWLPVPSNVPANPAPGKVATVRERYSSGAGQLVGHFGIGSRFVEGILLRFIPALLHDRTDAAFLLIGKGSEKFAREMHAAYPKLIPRIFYTGVLPSDEISAHIAACDLMVLPYVDGISARRTAAMAVLANGCPLLTTSAHSTEPFWLECAAIAIVPASDLDGLALTARNLLADSVERARLAAAGRRLYDSVFDVSYSVHVLRGDRPSLQAELLKFGVQTLK